MTSNDENAPLVEIRNLRFAGGVSDGVPGCDFSEIILHERRVYALIGKSGCGKSLFLSLLAAFPPQQWRSSETGNVEFQYFRKKISPENFRSSRKYSAAMRDVLADCGVEVFYLPQKLPSDEAAGTRCEKALKDIVRAVVSGCPKERIFAEAEEFFRKFDLFFVWNKCREKRISKLSGGERKRFEICARLIAHKIRGNGTALFLLDEPTAGLDPENARLFFEGIKNLEKSRAAFVIATHDFEGNADCFTDKISLEKSSEGKVIAECEPLSGNIADGNNDTAAENPPCVLSGTRGFGGDFRRIFRRQTSGWSARVWLPVVVVNVAVAVLVWLAFLKDCEHGWQLSRFLFFSTLYCFWIGLFNACQTINGARESGEWQYWTLGFRRSFFRWFTANAFSALLFALIQSGIFLATLFITSCLFGNKSILQIGGEKSFSNELRGFFSTGTFFPECLPCMVILPLAFFLAVCSGISLGILFSSLIKRSSGSLRTAVAVVVAVMITSSLVLEQNKEYVFISEYADGKEDDFQKPILSALSFALPQRYFFNVANCVLSEKTNDAVDELKKNTKNDAKAWDELRKIGLAQYGNDLEGKETAKKRVLESGVPRKILKILCSRVLGEVAVIMVWCGFVLCFAFLSVKYFFSRYYDIR